MTSKAFILFIFSGPLLCTAFLLAFLKTRLGITSPTLIGFLATLSFGISIAGIIIGFEEVKKKKAKVWIGLIGNITVFIILGIIGLMYM